MYCTVEEVRPMLKNSFVGKVVADRYLETEEERDAALTPLIEAAIADACAEIDGYLAGRYPVPMAPTPHVIGKFSKDIAVYNLISRAGLDEQGMEKNFLTRYNSAIRFLEMVATGKVSIGIGQESGSTLIPPSYIVKASGRVFDRHRLEGM